jgi:WhiB family redox-sensing transcriptional regulator
MENESVMFGQDWDYLRVWEVLREPPTWMERGACKGFDVELFFPHSGQNNQMKEVLENFCGVCVVRTNCLNYAIDNYCHGIWGGTTSLQRRKLRKEA